jgi:hypothetical protein
MPEFGYWGKLQYYREKTEFRYKSNIIRHFGENCLMMQSKIYKISLDLLYEHPENSNFMDTNTARKLRKHIELTGHYEPLTVRPHPTINSKFQVINGHNRLRVLRILKYKAANCIIWNMDDKQARIYLATLNRLSGKDIPERRAVIIEQLLRSFDTEELISLLPDDKKQIEKLSQLASLDFPELSKSNTVQIKCTAPVILSFTMEESEASELNLAIDLALNREKVDTSRSEALVCIARFYLHKFNE